MAKCVMVDVPKGLSVATSPPVLRLTVTSVIYVVLPSGLSLRSLKVELVIERGSIFSERVAVRLAEGATPVAVCLGEVLIILGGPGTGSVGGGVVPGNPSALQQSSPEQALRALRRGCSSE